MRIETVTRELFTYDELDDNAKEAARNWWREGGLNYEWWDSTIDDFRTIAGLMGITIDHKEIFFSGFWSQGNGASFYGEYAYRQGAAKSVREHAPQDEELHRIADTLQAIQRRYFYQLSATVRRAYGAGNYCHENTVEVTVSDRHGELDGIEAADTIDAVTEALRDLMRWLYRTLEKEYEFLNSDEQVAETIEANEYEFTENGEP